MNTPRKIFNPLFHATTPSVGENNAATASSSDKGMVATAAIFNEKVGECPKCKTSMQSAQIANNDTVFFCSACRVSTPMQD